MDLVLKGIQILPSILKGKQYGRWCHRQDNKKKGSTKIKTRSSHILSNNVLQNWIEKQIMRNSGDHSAGFSQTSGSDRTSDRTFERQWKSTSKDYKSDSPLGVLFRVISYNILSQNLLIKHLNLYKQCNQLYLRWSYRLQQLSEEIIAQSPDILCLQEVQDNHLGDIYESIKRDLPMSILYKKKTGIFNDGCAILYNENLFELVTSTTVEYYQPEYELLNRHQIGLIAKLRCKSNPVVTFLVCTTHLLFNPRRQDVRLAQLVIFLAEIDRLSVEKSPHSNELKRIPIILSGDFNLIAESAPFELITSGHLDYEFLSRLRLTDPCDPFTEQTGKILIPAKLGITDQCQHIDCVLDNYTEMSHRLHHSRKVENISPKKLPSIESYRGQFSTGTLTHNLNLKSVYNHFTGESLASTFQGEWITVDHLFYSEPDQSKSGEAHLKLVSVYQLPTVHQCRTINSLPGAKFGSDHLMLGANLYLAFPQ